MQLLLSGQTNVLSLPVVSKSSGSPITSGTVTFQLKALTGTNAGKWYKGAGGTWEATEQNAGNGTHSADGHWELSLGTAVWTNNVNYNAYAKESGDLHIPVAQDLLVVPAVGSAGAGDYATTITIRTTGSTPVSGVAVWVNTSNTRSGSVAGTIYTNGSGEAVFYLAYNTYYVFCNLAGYSFSAANFTSASGSVAFTKDIATAISVGASSNYSNSFLSRAVTTVREMLDEPAINKKYTDTRIITQLEKSYCHSLGEVNRNTRTQAVGTYSVSISTGSSSIQNFALPHNAGNILAVYVEGDYGERYHFNSRGRHNVLGRGVWIDGNILRIQPQAVWSTTNSGSATLKIEHVPVGVAQLHNGVLTLDADGDAATLGASPNVGALDTHPSAYLGCTLRILEVDGTTVTGNVMQERAITAYNSTTRVATLTPVLDPIPTTDDGNIYYEIAPTIHKGMDEIVATYTAYAIALTEGNHKRANGILKRYQTEIRNLRLTSYYSRMDEATKQRGDSYYMGRYPVNVRSRW